MPVSGLSSDVIALSAGGAHTCALTTGGGVLCWGVNAAGQLGTGNTTSSTIPVPVSGLSSGIIALSAGSSHTCALTTGGGVLCWGVNAAGQLGTGNTTDSAIPVAVSGLSSGIIALSAGSSHTCALTTGGGIFCRGQNSTGQLGTGNTTSSTIPVAVRALASGVIALNAGSSHTCALTTGGGVLCWGYNFFGQLGTGNNSNSSIPLAVSGLSSGVSALSAGGSHTCALTTGGGVLCWGENTFGGLGTGNDNNSSIPLAVSGLSSGITLIDTGSAHTCAVSTTGAIHCWGFNAEGQLGTGNTTDSNVPLAIAFTATITVVLDMQPNSNANLAFTGDLGNFQLDDPTTDDGDTYTTTKQFIVSPGAYIVAAIVPTPYVARVSCIGSVTRIGRSAVSLSLSATQQVVCTFTNQRPGQITASKYNDHNHNHVRNSSDEWLSGWTMQLFTSPSAQVGVQTTNTNGSASFPNLRPGGYTVCEVMQPDWFNITPSVLTHPYQKPCYSVTLAPGQVAAVRFGNSTTPLVAVAEAGAFDDVIVMDLPDTDDDGNEVTPLPDPWPDVAEAQVSALFLPLVAR